MAVPEKPLSVPQKPRNGEKFALVIHGGAGTMSRETATPEMQALYRAALKAALRAGYAVLSEGGEAMDAAVAAVTSLEGRALARHNRIISLSTCLDCPLFNAGKGAVFNKSGKVCLASAHIPIRPTHFLSAE
jgi:L-asparaginase / beta-aspartyl-peptidase